MYQWCLCNVRTSQGPVGTSMQAILIDSHLHITLFLLENISFISCLLYILWLCVLTMVIQCKQSGYETS